MLSKTYLFGTLLALGVVFADEEVAYRFFSPWNPNVQSRDCIALSTSLGEAQAGDSLALKGCEDSAEMRWTLNPPIDTVDIQEGIFPPLPDWTGTINIWGTDLSLMVNDDGNLVLGHYDSQPSSKSLQWSLLGSPSPEANLQSSATSKCLSQAGWGFNFVDCHPGQEYQC
ncbi:hypothetical protein BCR39DRAFT_560903 [Naematelia encephala]|uniref:Ricin B lectin domain-containing protein n=1 Tax=Naematelia encephala TaxID=71784 RepID=A0A1Y2AT55_9TREE|nr:hypothetical protein BCR39DRAFT_560903 [Naematelia encephala]